MMINLSTYNKLGHSHRAHVCEPATHQTEAALPSVLTTASSSSSTFLVMVPSAVITPAKG